jgi:hypothetical protein
MEEITKKLMNDQRNDEEEADFLTELMEEKPNFGFGGRVEEMQKDAHFYLSKKFDEAKKGIPPELEKTLELFKKLLKSKEVNMFLY